jgi:molybdate transport system regulatory protein
LIAAPITILDMASRTSAVLPAIRPRVYLADEIAVGPGKVDLLRHVAATRSISAAARAMGMSYSRAWQLIDAMNRHFGSVVTTSTGGRGGGGAMLTPAGRALVDAYAALEARLNATAAREIAALVALVQARRRR